MKYMKT